MKNLKYLIFIPCILLFSCYDHNDIGISLTEYKGQIISNETKLPVKNLKVKLKYLDKKFVDSVSTDDNGNFLFSVLNFDARDYQIFINHKDGILTIANQKYFFDPIAYLKLNTINENAVNKNDLIYFTNIDFAVKGLNNQTNLLPILYGSPKFVQTLEYEVTKNGKKAFFKKDIQLRGLDTLQVNINY